MEYEKKQKTFEYHGFGVGLRHCHFDTFLNKKYSGIGWVEVVTENFLPWKDGKTRRPFSILEKIRQDLPIALHGVSLSIGSADKLNRSYLKRLRTLVNQISPCVVSDHLCWTGVDGENLHDLLPLPYSKNVVNWVADKISEVQDLLGRRILIENVSSYVEFSPAEMPEWEFIKEIVKRTDCGILLDVNNIYVSARNHGFDPLTYLKAVPKASVGQIHLAGHTDKGTHLIDTHDESVCDDVWTLFRWVARNYQPVNTMIEWDDNIPDWPVLQKEVHKAKSIWEKERRSDVKTANTLSFAAQI